MESFFVCRQLLARAGGRKKGKGVTPDAFSIDQLDHCFYFLPLRAFFFGRATFLFPGVFFFDLAASGGDCGPFTRPRTFPSGSANCALTPFDCLTGVITEQGKQSLLAIKKKIASLKIHPFLR
jgi:hypothetical protein